MKRPIICCVAIIAAMLCSCSMSDFLSSDSEKDSSVVEKAIPTPDSSLAEESSIYEDESMKRLIKAIIVKTLN